MSVDYDSVEKSFPYAQTAGECLQYINSWLSADGRAVSQFAQICFAQSSDSSDTAGEISNSSILQTDECSGRNMYLQNGGMDRTGLFANLVQIKVEAEAEVYTFAPSSHGRRLPSIGYC